METTPKASVIILSWNARSDLETCLKAVFAQDYDNTEVIVVDNGSVDESANFVATHFPQAKLIRNEQNLGFAAGNNLGLQVAEGDILVLLNQDTEVHPSWLRALVEGLSSDAEIGIVGGKALYPDQTLQHAGGQVNLRGEGHHYGLGSGDTNLFDQQDDVDYVTGATLAISRQALETIGLLDEGFGQAYYEDVDWCYRAKKVGFRVVYVPQAVLIHKENSQSTEMSYESLFGFQRNRLRFVLKHWPLPRLWDEFVSAEQNWLLNLGEGSEILVTAVQHAYLHHLLHLAEIMAWRQALLHVSVDEGAGLAEALLQLRAIVPLRPAGIGLDPMPKPDHLKVRPSLDLNLPQKSTDAAVVARPIEDKDEDVSDADGVKETIDPSLETIDPEQLERLVSLHQRWTLQPHEFQSDVPVLGPAIARFRQQWNRISTEWYVLPLIEQQNDFNSQAVLAIDYLIQRSILYAEVLNSQRERMSHQDERMSHQDERMNHQQARLSRAESLWDYHERRLDYHENRLQQEWHDRQKLAEVLGQYIAENGREIAELAREVQRLKTLLD